MARMAIPMPEVRPLDKPVEMTVRPGAVRTGNGWVDGPNLTMDFRVSMPWRFTKGKGRSSWSTEPGFSRVKVGSIPCPNEHVITNVLDAAGRFSDYLAERADAGDPLAIGELDGMKKVSVQKDFHPGYHLKSASPPRKAPNPRFRHYVREFLRQCHDRLPPGGKLSTPPLSTNAGFPTYTRGFGAKIASLGSFDRHPAVMAENARRTCRRYGLPEQCALGYALNTRTGPLAKWAPFWEFAGGRWSAPREAISMWSRRRLVWMGSFCVLAGMREVQSILKASFVDRFEGLYHTPDRDQATMLKLERIAANGGVIMEGDFTTYDLTVTRDEQEIVAEEVARRYPDLFFEAEMYAFSEQLPYLSPSYDFEESPMGHVTLITREGETSSGNLWTNIVGQIISYAALMMALEAAGIADPIAATRNGNVAIMMQGDDLLFAAPRFDYDAFISSYDSLGLKLKLFASRRFLSKYRVGNHAYPLAYRIIQQSFFNEHEVLGSAFLPIAVLGLRERWGIGPHPSLVERTEEVLKLSNLYALTGVYNGPTAAAWLASGDGKRQLESILARLASSGWLAELVKDAEHSASSAALLEAVEDAGITVDDSYDRQGWTLVNRMLNLPPAKREYVGYSIVDKMASGPDIMDAEAVKLLGNLRSSFM